MIKITLHGTRFEHDGVAHIAPLAMVEGPDGSIVGSMSPETYITRDHRMVPQAMQVAHTVFSLAKILRGLGHEVEVGSIDAPLGVVDWAQREFAK